MVVFESTVPSSDAEDTVIKSTEEHFMNASRMTGISDVHVHICGMEYDGCTFIPPDRIVCSIYRLMDDFRGGIYYAPYHEFGHLCASRKKLYMGLGNNRRYEISKREFSRHHPGMDDCPDDIYMTSVNDLVVVIPEFLADMLINRNTEVNEYYVDWVEKNHMGICRQEYFDRDRFINTCRLYSMNYLLNYIGSSYRICDSRLDDTYIIDGLASILGRLIQDTSRDMTLRCIVDVYRLYIDALSRRE